MLLLRGATTGRQVCNYQTAVSIHAPLARSNELDIQRVDSLPVSIHAPLARSNSGHMDCAILYIVSIHAPLARSNFTMDNLWGGQLFQYMLLLRGATDKKWDDLAESSFQYMLLLRGATLHGAKNTPYSSFQYMLLLRGATCRPHSPYLWSRVSIHAPLARSNEGLRSCDGAF